ncbi:MAG TPA: transporter [Polyangiaceae bacterium]|nr:transporter [Polyangiaceae bacterium]
MTSRTRSAERAAHFCAALLLLAACIAPKPARAGNQEPAGINLGATSFVDGFGRNEEGFTWLGYLQYAMARRINGDVGQALPFFNDPRIDVFLFINQLVYVLPEKLFDDHAHLGMDFLLPLVAFDTHFSPAPPAPGFQLKDNGVGFGDLTFGPFLQFRPIVSDGRPVFSARVEVDMIAPIGAYDPYVDINQGTNFPSLVPNVALTVMPIAHLEVSARINYLYNFKNYRPALGRNYFLASPPLIKDAQAGQAGWINFAASYEILSGLHLGVNGYYFRQFNLDLYEMQDGSSNPGTGYGDTGELKYFAIGPGGFWQVAAHDTLFANVYFQTVVENGPQSNVFQLRWVHGF